MEKVCAFCGKIFSTDYESKVYCDKKCADKAALERDESFYDYPKETAIPIRSFECALCGKTVHIYSRYDQRSRFCCGKHAKMFKSSEYRKKYSKNRGSNIGMSGGMSLGSLIRREMRDL